LQQKRERNKSQSEYYRARFQNIGLEWNLFIKLTASSPPPQDSAALLHEFNQVKEEYRENIIFCSKLVPRRCIPECVLKWRKLLPKLLDAPVVTAEAGT
jgi:hypothetical protein